MKIAAFILLKNSRPSLPLEIHRTKKQAEYVKQPGEKICKCFITYEKPKK